MFKIKIGITGYLGSKNTIGLLESKNGIRKNILLSWAQSLVLIGQPCLVLSFYIGGKIIGIGKHAMELILAL